MNKMNILEVKLLGKGGTFPQNQTIAQYFFEKKRELVQFRMEDFCQSRNKALEEINLDDTHVKFSISKKDKSFFAPPTESEIFVINDSVYSSEKEEYRKILF